MIDDVVKSPGELVEEIRALRAEVAALRGRGASRRDEVAADSEAWFRELADTIPQIVWTARPDGFLDYYNRRWYELGGRAGAYGDDSWTPAIHPDDVAGVLARWRSSVQMGRPMEDNAFRLRDGRSGEYRWHIGRATPVRDAAGEILRWVGTTTDVHDLKVAQGDMREQRERLEAALAASGTGTFRWNFRTDELTWDENLDRLFGLRPGETARSLEQFLSLVHPEDRQGVIDRCRRCRDEGADFDMEFRVVGPDGSVRWLDDKGRTFFDAADGRPSYMTGACVDVTVRRQAGDALRESGARLRQLADAMPQIVWMTDADGAVDYFNRGWEEYTGLAVHESLGGAWGDVVHPDDRAAAVARWRRAVETGEPFDNEHRWQLARGVPVRDGGGAVVRWFGTSTDIHEQRLGEEAAREARDEAVRARAQAEEANRAKDDFLAALSHELRTPLTPVMVTAQMLEDDHTLSAEVRHDLGIIRRNVELETRLIDDLLDLTRVSRGKLTLNVDRVDVHAILRDAMRTCSDDVAAQKRLDVRLEAGAAHHHVRGDAARLSQIFWNLIKNAVKFTPAGGSVVLRTANPSAEHVEVRVIDTGVGIEADVLPLVFNAFEQGGAAVTRKFGGLGLGLAISKALAELHGGRIEAHSDGPGFGATFTLTLPAVATRPADAVEVATRAAVGAARARANAADPSAARGRRILLVEDHEQTAKALRRLLSNLGYVVEWRASVTEALDAAGRLPFDLVLSDIGLPDGSGLELMRELRERHRLSGIALSGYGMEQDLASSAAAGFLEHLVKPISKDLLGAALRRHLV